MAVMTSRQLIPFFSVFALFYIWLAWLVSGGESWWVIDYIDGQNVFFGDDAYRFFLCRSAFLDEKLYLYNFVLPAQLLLDGIIINLVSGDLYYSRIAHALLGVAILALVYSIGRKIRLSNSSILFSVLVMAFIPRFALMSLSFYGEVWLTLFLCLSVFFYLKKRNFLFAILGGLLPLIRPEGIFFLIPLGAKLAWQRDFKSFFILISPGAVYFFYLLASLDSFEDYYYWRIELRAILDKIDYEKETLWVLSVYSPLFVFGSLLGLFNRKSRLIWPFLAGCGIWLAWLQFSIFLGMATFESRYSYVLIPFLVVLFACACDFLYCFIIRGNKGKALISLVLFLFSVAVSADHFMSTDNLRIAVQKKGLAYVFDAFVNGDFYKIYAKHDKEDIEARKEINSIALNLTKSDSGIDRFAIYDAGLYYFLDPHLLPDRVTVGFLTNGYMVFHILLDGQSFVQHAGGRMYSYLEYGEPDFDPSEKRALVATIMPLVGYPYTWKKGKYELYLFSYLDSSTPRVDVDTRSDITPDMIEKAYRSWYGR